MVVSPTFIIEYDMGKYTKEFIISHFFKDSKGLVINTKHTKRAYLEENGFDDLYDYYDDSKSLTETLYRIINDIDVRPVCPVCGNELYFNTHDGCYRFEEFCSLGCIRKSDNYVKDEYALRNVDKDVIKRLLFNNGKLVPIRCKETYLKKVHLYDALIDYYPNASSFKQVIWMILNDYKEPPKCKFDGCDEYVKFNRSKFEWTECCCDEHMYYQRSVDMYGRYIQSFDDIPNKCIESQIAVVDAYKESDEMFVDLKKHKHRKYKQREEKNYKSIDEKPEQFINMRATHQQKSIDLWKSRGLDIEYVRRGNDYNIIVHNCCKIHGDIEFTLSQFNNRSKRRDITPMCLECNPLNKRGKSNIEYIIKGILDDLKIEYIYADREFCNPYETDFYLTKYNIGIECNGIKWHSGLENYKRHVIKQHMAHNKNGKMIFIWEDEALKHKDEVKEYIIHIINGGEIKPIISSDYGHDFFFCNTHTFERVYNKDDITNDYGHWELCYILKEYNPSNDDKCECCKSKI